jgi:16S rRNA (cytidine1402-2'-O)-methyltransferase
MPAVAPGLYLLPSPLGNLGDLSQRFIDIVSRADLVAAEDTRRTLALLSHLGLRKKIVCYREDNRRRALPGLLSRLEKGEVVALVTDAGAPGICDPGPFLVSEARKAGHGVFPVPGPSAVITALMASGFETSTFSFLGFPPARASQRQNFFLGLKDRPEALVFFVPPHKLADTLAGLASVFGPRPAFMAREMTKLHEEYLSLDLVSLLESVTKSPRRGEVTLVIGPAAVGKVQGDLAESRLSEEDLRLIDNDPRPTKEAASHYAKIYGCGKKAMYGLILERRAKFKAGHEEDLDCED